MRTASLPSAVSASPLVMLAYGTVPSPPRVEGKGGRGGWVVGGGVVVVVGVVESYINPIELL